MARLALGVIVILIFLFLGEKKTQKLKNKLVFVDDYRKLMRELESAIRCVRKNMFEFFNLSNFKPPFIMHLILNKNQSIDESRQNFTCETEEEKIVKIILPALSFAQSSSDIEGISASLNYADEQLCQYQRELKEELDGKIKTTPYLYFLCGVFIAVLIL